MFSVYTFDLWISQGLRVSTLCTIQNWSVTLQSALPVLGFSSPSLTNWRLSRTAALLSAFSTHTQKKPTYNLRSRLRYSTVSKESACNTGDPGSIPLLGRSPGEGNGNPLQDSCLENPMDREAWQATVHGVTRVGYDLPANPSLVKSHQIRIVSQTLKLGSRVLGSISITIPSKVI